MARQIASIFAVKKDEYTASQIAANNVAKRAYQKEYMEYWNSTSELTGTGRPVDALIAPLAPFAAARPDMYTYYGTSSWAKADSLSFDRNKFGNEAMRAKRIMPGLSTWVNMLDYTAAVLPVTLADKNVDVFDEGYKPLNEQDEKVFLACESTFYVWWEGRACWFE
jgi:amidase